MVYHNCERVIRTSTGKKRAVRAWRGGAMARTVEGVTRELEQVHIYPSGDAPVCVTPTAACARVVTRTARQHGRLRLIAVTATRCN
eukprot:1158817-Prymnesium_polylepis.1